MQEVLPQEVLGPLETEHHTLSNGLGGVTNQGEPLRHVAADVPVSKSEAGQQLPEHKCVG